MSSLSRSRYRTTSKSLNGRTAVLLPAVDLTHARRVHATSACPRSPRAGAGGARALRPSRPERLREQNRGGERFSFIDGPITANNPGVHTPGGGRSRTSSALQGVARLRPAVPEWLDCQGLWVEVEVEKSLGLNSKRDTRSTASPSSPPAAANVRRRVRGGNDQLGDRRLGRWMDWDNDYYTFSDTNIEYIWRFLKTVHERGWLYRGHRSTNGALLRHLAVAARRRERRITRSSTTRRHARFPLSDRAGESLVAPTTTPWTAARERRRRCQAGRGVRPTRRRGGRWP